MDPRGWRLSESETRLVVRWSTLFDSESCFYLDDSGIKVGMTVDDSDSEPHVLSEIAKTPVDIP